MIGVEKTRRQIPCGAVTYPLSGLTGSSIPDPPHGAKTGLSIGAGCALSLVIGATTSSLSRQGLAFHGHLVQSRVTWPSCDPARTTP